MLRYLILIGILGTLFSCKGLNSTQSEDSTSNELKLGKIIDQLNDGVSIIFQDSQNNYWFAHEGVVKYDGKTLIQFTTYDGLYSNAVRGIQEDHLGNIYFDTGEGINKFDGKTIEKLKVTNDPVKAKMLQENDLWFVGEWDLNGVYRYDGKKLYHLKLPKHELDEEARTYSSGGGYEIYANYTSFKDKDGNVWIGNCIFGACRFDGENFLWISEREMTELDWGPSMGVRSIVQDDEGNIFFGSNVTSKYAISEVDGIAQYQKLPGIDMSSIPDIPSACMSMAIDEQGAIWMVHYKGGVWKFDGKSLVHFPILTNGKEAELFSIYKDRNGTLWLGSHDAGTWKFDGNTFVRFKPTSQP